MRLHHLLSCGIVLVLTGCASQPSADDHQSRSSAHHQNDSDDHEAGERPPRIGMTKDQVINEYGQPVDVSTSGRGGEEWTYVFNNFDGRAFIPYYGAFHEAYKKRRSGVIFFDSNGRVADFHWNTTNPAGATVFR